MATQQIAEVVLDSAERSPAFRGTKDKIAVVGASGHARVVLDILRLQGMQVVGLLDTYKPVGSALLEHVVIGSCQDLPGLLRDGRVNGIIVAIGDNWIRARMASEIRHLAPDIPFVTAIHPSAQIASDVVIGAGTAVMAGAVINPGSVVGEFCIVNTRASLDHESVMESYASLGPGVTTGGCVRIGAFSVIGISATILQELKIGRHSIVGASATVFHDVPDEVVVYGTPARVIRARKPGDRYFGGRKMQPNATNNGDIG